MGHRDFRFGEWNIDLSGNVVSDGNTRTQLEPRVMDVLRYLCRHPGAVIPAEELLQACWGSNEMGDNPVHKAITQLRRALGDSSTDPRYIETIRKRGYRAIATVVEAAEPVADGWTKGSPFRGLEAFQENHAAIFFGRVQATTQLRNIVLAQAADGHAMTLVLGPSGSGKTSLVRAGLLPQLMASPANTEEPVALDCSVYLDCADLGGGGLFQALAAALIDADLDGLPLFPGESAATLGLRLEQESVQVAAQLHQRCSKVRIGLFTDRLEAIFRSPGITAADREQFIAVLDHLATSTCVLVVLACRNDFYPDIVALPALMALKARGGHFDLSAPDGADIAQIVRLPARLAKLSFERDAASGASLDDVLCDAARGSPDTLPLLQYCLNELYRQRSESGELQFSVFAQLGGIEGAVGVRAEQVVAALSAEQMSALPRVLSLLVNIGEEQGAVTARRSAWSLLLSENEKELVRAMVEARLFVSELAGEVPSFGVAHEALLRRWPRVVEWIERYRHSLQLRTRLSSQALRWAAAGRARDLLLPNGIQVSQAAELLKLADFSLAPLEDEFIRSSMRRAKLGDRIRLGVMSLIATLAVLAGVLGLTARSAQLEAEQHRSEAEGLMGFMLGEFLDKLRPLGRLDLLDNISARALSYLSTAQLSNASETSLAQRAKALEVIAEVNRSRANAPAAIEALKAGRKILAYQGADTTKDKFLLKSLGANAFWLGQIYLDKNDLVAAERHFTEYRIFSDRLAAVDPTDIDAWIEQSYAHHNLGSVATRQGNLTSAALSYANSVELKRRAVRAKPDNLDFQVTLANGISGLADLKTKLGLLDEALSLHRQAEELLLPLHKRSPGNALWTSRLGYGAWRQAELKVALGQDEAAQELFKRAEAYLAAALEQDQSNHNWRTRHAAIKLRRMEHQGNAGRRNDAEELLVLLDKIHTLAALEPGNVDLAILLARSQLFQGSALIRQGKYHEARKSLDDAIAELQGLHQKGKTDIELTSILANALLARADLARHERDAQGVSTACHMAQTVLAPTSKDSSDFNVLAPLVAAHVCTDDGAAVAAQLGKLKQNAYRDAQFLRFLASHPPQKGIP